MNEVLKHAGLELLAEAARDGALGGRSFRVRGGCMAPLLVDGDTVTLAAAPGPLLPGQVVLARVGAELLCHRLLDCGGGICRVAGDGDLRLDVLPAADLIGRVAAIATLRFGGARLELPAAPSAGDRFSPAGWPGAAAAAASSSCGSKACAAGCWPAAPGSPGRAPLLSLPSALDGSDRSSARAPPLKPAAARLRPGLRLPRRLARALR